MTNPSPTTLPSHPGATAAVAAAIDLKATDVRVLDLGQVSDFTDYFLLCTGSNSRQVKAIADRVLERTKAAGQRPLHVEGLAQGQWVLLDFGDLVVHVFDEPTRAYYGLERLWSDAPDVTSSLTASST